LRMRAEVLARARLVACALAGAAIVLYISSVKDDENAELYQHQKNIPATMFTINAERIAHGLEEKNRINAEKVIVSYTREDKILAGFQKAVKERDAQFRDEVAQAAKESEAEEAATHHFDNNGDPDDPKYKYEIAHSITPKQEIKSKFEQASEQKSEKVESHIDHEVAEITGENQVGSVKNAIKPKRIHVEPAKKKLSVLSRDDKSKDEKSRPIRTAEDLEKYMHSPSYHEARAAAKKKADAAENAIASRLENAERKKDTPAAKLSEASQNLNKASSLNTIKSKLSHDQEVLPEDLEKYSEHAPIDLKDYMKSPEYLKIRSSAERASERYYEERARRLEQKKTLMTNAAAKPEGEGADSQSTGPTASGNQESEMQIKTEENSKKFTGLDHNKNGEEHLAKASTLAGTQAHRQVSKPSLADDDDSDEPEDEDAPKDEPEEPSEPDDPTEDVPSGNVPEGEGLGEENQIRKTREFTKESHGGRVVQVKEGPNTPTTKQLADSYTAHEATVGDQRTKESKLQLLRHFMETNEFKQQEYEARSESAPKAK